MGLVPKPVMGAVMNAMSLLRMFLIASASERMSAMENASSTVRLLVPALTSSAKRTGLVKVSKLSDWSISALDEGLLATTPGDVTLAELVPLADERQRGRTVEVVHAHVHGAQARFGAGLLGVDVHPTNRIGHRLEPVETDEGHMVERNVD